MSSNKSLISPRYTDDELNKLSKDPGTSCVFLHRRTKSLFLHPFHLRDLRRGVKDALHEALDKFDPEFEGILLAYRRAKVLTSIASISADVSHAEVRVEADYYYFKPAVGSKIKGIVHKRSSDLVGCLTLGKFNIACPREEEAALEEDLAAEWLGSTVHLGQEITVKLTKVELRSSLPYIRGRIARCGEWAGSANAPETETEEIDSGIGGRDTSSERDKMAPVAPPKTKKKKKTSEKVLDTPPTPPEPPKKKKKQETPQKMAPPVNKDKKNKLVSKLSLKKPQVPSDSDSDAIFKETRKKKSILSQLESQSMTQFRESVGCHSTPKFCELDVLDTSLLCTQKSRLSKDLLAPKSPLLFSSQSQKSQTPEKKPKKVKTSESGDSEEEAPKPSVKASVASPVASKATSKLSLTASLKKKRESSESSDDEAPSKPTAKLGWSPTKPVKGKGDSDSSSEEEERLTKSASKNKPVAVKAPVKPSKKKKESSDSSSEEEEKPKSPVKLVPQKKPVVIAKSSSAKSPDKSKEDSSDSSSEEEEAPISEVKPLRKPLIMAVTKQGDAKSLKSNTITKSTASKPQQSNSEFDDESDKTTTAAASNDIIARLMAAQKQDLEESDDSDSSVEKLIEVPLKPSPVKVPAPSVVSREPTFAEALSSMKKAAKKGQAASKASVQPKPSSSSEESDGEPTPVPISNLLHKAAMAVNLKNAELKSAAVAALLANKTKKSSEESLNKEKLSKVVLPSSRPKSDSESSSEGESTSKKVPPPTRRGLPPVATLPPRLADKESSDSESDSSNDDPPSKNLKPNQVQNGNEKSTGFKVPPAPFRKRTDSSSSLGSKLPTSPARPFMSPTRQRNDSVTSTDSKKLSKKARIVASEILGKQASERELTPRSSPIKIAPSDLQNMSASEYLQELVAGKDCDSLSAEDLIKQILASVQLEEGMVHRRKKFTKTRPKESGQRSQRTPSTSPTRPPPVPSPSRVPTPSPVRAAARSSARLASSSSQATVPSPLASPAKQKAKSDKKKLTSESDESAKKLQIKLLKEQQLKLLSTIEKSPLKEVKIVLTPVSVVPFGDEAKKERAKKESKESKPKQVSSDLSPGLSALMLAKATAKLDMSQPYKKKGKIAEGSEQDSDVSTAEPSEKQSSEKPAVSETKPPPKVSKSKKQKSASESEKAESVDEMIKDLVSTAKVGVKSKKKFTEEDSERPQTKVSSPKKPADELPSERQAKPVKSKKQAPAVVEKQSDDLNTSELIKNLISSAKGGSKVKKPSSKKTPSEPQNKQKETVEKSAELSATELIKNLLSTAKGGSKSKKKEKPEPHSKKMDPKSPGKLVSPAPAVQPAAAAATKSKKKSDAPDVPDLAQQLLANAKQSIETPKDRKRKTSSSSGQSKSKKSSKKSKKDTSATSDAELKKNLLLFLAQTKNR